jgi:hypothetical protein
VTTKVNMPSNEQPYAVELRVCNEKAPAGCTLSGAKPAQSYGPLGDALLDVRPVVDGKNVYWVISGTANGSPVSVRYDVEGDVTTLQPAGTGQFSLQTKTFTTSRYRQNIRISVAVFDPSKPGRGQDSGDNTATSGNPPPPLVSISRGDRCGDGPQTTNPCKTNGFQSPMPRQQLQLHPAHDLRVRGELPLLDPGHRQRRLGVVQPELPRRVPDELVLRGRHHLDLVHRQHGLPDQLRHGLLGHQQRLTGACRQPEGAA